MRAAAPAVHAELGPGRPQRIGVALLHAWAAAALAAWLAHQVRGTESILPPPWLCAAGAGLLATALAWLLQPPPPHALQWDGGVWQLHLSGGVIRDGDVDLRLDLGHAVLLRHLASGDGRARWFLATRHQAGSAWHGLRVALRHAHAKPRTGTAA